MKYNRTIIISILISMFPVTIPFHSYRSVFIRILTFLTSIPFKIRMEGWVICYTPVDFRASLRLALQTTARSNYIHETYVHNTNEKSRSSLSSAFTIYTLYCEPALNKRAALLLIKVVLHIFYILLKLC